MPLCPNRWMRNRGRMRPWTRAWTPASPMPWRTLASMPTHLSILGRRTRMETGCRTLLIVHPKMRAPEQKPSGTARTCAALERRPAATESGPPALRPQIAFATHQARLASFSAASGQMSERCADGAWMPTSECLDEGPCAPADVESMDRGNCGVNQRICQTDCNWGDWAVVTPRGECSPGSRQCDPPTGTDRLCNSMCMWEDDPACAVNP